MSIPVNLHLFTLSEPRATREVTPPPSSASATPTERISIILRGNIELASRREIRKVLHSSLKAPLNEHSPSVLHSCFLTSSLPSVLYMIYKIERCHIRLHICLWRSFLAQITLALALLHCSQSFGFLRREILLHAKPLHTEGTQNCEARHNESGVEANAQRVIVCL
jgi:hypothetical protein